MTGEKGHFRRTPGGATGGKSHEKIGASSGPSSGQLFQQRLGRLQVRCVKGLREPAVDPYQQLTGVFTLPLTLPHPTETERHAQLQRLRLLAAGDLQRLTQTGFRLGDLGARIEQK
jgi:hypothetical protein